MYYFVTGKQYMAPLRMEDLKHLSEECQTFIERNLSMNPALRMSTGQVVASPWLRIPEETLISGYSVSEDEFETSLVLNRFNWTNALTLNDSSALDFSPQAQVSRSLFSSFVDKCLSPADQADLLKQIVPPESQGQYTSVFDFFEKQGLLRFDNGLFPQAASLSFSYKILEDHIKTYHAESHGHYFALFSFLLTFVTRVNVLSDPRLRSPFNLLFDRLIICLRKTTSIYFVLSSLPQPSSTRSSPPSSSSSASSSSFSASSSQPDSFFEEKFGGADWFHAALAQYFEDHNNKADFQAILFFNVLSQLKGSFMSNIILSKIRSHTNP